MPTISLGGDIRRLNRHLQKLSQLDLEGANQTIAEALRSSTKLRFKTSTGPDGQVWVRSLKLNGKKGRTLVDTARLRNSIRGRATAEVAEVGTNVIYAGRHQFGDKRPMVIKAKTSSGLRFKIGNRWITKKQVTVKLPARPYLGISKEDKEEIKSIMEQTVEDTAK